MLRTVCGIAVFVVSACAANAARAHDPVPFANALAAVAPAQYGNQWQPGPGWDRDIDVRCASSGYQYNLCQVDTGQGSRVAIVRQVSKTRCVEGRNWGWNRAGVWVDQGCEGVFRVQRRWAGGGQRPDTGNGGAWQPGPDWDRAITVTCGSPQYNYAMCQVDTGRGGSVQLQRQTSDARCIRGRTWGFNRAGVWVDKGCSGVFVVERRWR
ncbi:MAG: DUF3011 domain-containing protein [Lysobacterales bacterium]